MDHDTIILLMVTSFCLFLGCVTARAKGRELVAAIIIESICIVIFIGGWLTLATLNGAFE